MPATKQLSTAARIERNAQVWRQSLKLNFREDGTGYRSLSMDDPNYEVLLAEIMHLHDDELPNDWRYGIIFDILSALEEETEGLPDPEDVVDIYDLLPGIAEALTDYTHYNLAHWLADKPSRHAWRDDDNIPASFDIMEMIRLRQTEEIEWMAVNIVDRLSAWQLY